MQGPWPRVGVLIGSLLRAPEVGLNSLCNLFKDKNVVYSIFIYTGPVYHESSVCHSLVETLKDYLRAEFKEAEPVDVAWEEEFEEMTASGSMRQWFKLSRAYKMMEARELKDGREFDIVLKTRTDVDFAHPIDLADFQEVLSSRVVYSYLDVVFMCRRDVARTLLGSLTEQLELRSGHQLRLLPINYDRFLHSEYGALTLQVFPEIGSGRFRRAARDNNYPVFRKEVEYHRGLLEDMHRRAEAGNSVQSFSYHWRYNNKTKEYKWWQKRDRLPEDNSMCSIRHWYYHIHIAEPEVTILQWTTPHPKMSLQRHYRHCNCEPWHCFRWDFPSPWLPHSLLFRNRCIRIIREREVAERM